MEEWAFRFLAPLTITTEQIVRMPLYSLIIVLRTESTLSLDWLCCRRCRCCYHRRCCRHWGFYFYLLQGGHVFTWRLFVCLPSCLSVCLSVSNFVYKLVIGSSWKLY